MISSDTIFAKIPTLFAIFCYNISQLDGVRLCFLKIQIAESHWQSVEPDTVHTVVGNQVFKVYLWLSKVRITHQIKTQTLIGAYRYLTLPTPHLS